MQLSFQKIEKLTGEFIERMVGWENHPAFRHLYGYFSNEESFHVLSTYEKIEKYYENYFETKNQETYYVCVNAEVVGEVNFIIDPDWLHKKVEHTAWFGGTVGNPDLWRQGIGYQAAQHIERRAIEKGAQRAELGVNEFNEASLHLARKLGYVEFDRIPDFTFWEGKMWADVRLEKTLIIS